MFCFIEIIDGECKKTSLEISKRKLEGAYVVFRNANIKVSKAAGKLTLSY